MNSIVELPKNLTILDYSIDEMMEEITIQEEPIYRSLIYRFNNRF